MTQIHGLHPLKSRVGDFIAGLKTLEKELITKARVSDFILQMQPPAEVWSPYLLWSRELYTRNLIHRDETFEVLALCWLPSQKTPIHSHDGQLGWLTVVQGGLVCINCRFVRPRVKTGTSIPAGNEAHRGRPVEVELLGSVIYEEDGRVAVVDRHQTTHRIEDLEISRYGSVRLNVYSKPIEAWVLFDETSRFCERRRVQHHSANGVILNLTHQRDGWSGGDKWRKLHRTNHTISVKHLQRTNDVWRESGDPAHSASHLKVITLASY